jgi:hypothetical protein
LFATKCCADAISCCAGSNERSNDQLVETQSFKVLRKTDSRLASDHTVREILKQDVFKIFELSLESKLLSERFSKNTQSADFKIPKSSNKR